MKRDPQRKSAAGDPGLSTKYIIVIESKHKPFTFMKIRTYQIAFSINTTCMCQRLNLQRDKICRLITK